MAIKVPAKKGATAPLAKGPTKAAPAAKAATKTAAAKPPKEVKPFVDGEIVIFKGYEKAPAKPLFKKDQELAVVEQREDNGVVKIACVPSNLYHKFKADENSVDGEEVFATEVRRTSKTVQAPFQLVPVGEMDSILKEESGDPLAIAQRLYNSASKSFFYFGGVLAKLWKETDPDTDKPLFCSYQDDANKNFDASKDGFEKFVQHSFGEEFSYRKAAYYMSIYESFSALPNAASKLDELGKVGWWKAGRLAQYVTPDNADALLKIAQEQSDEQLTATLKSQYTTEGSTPRGGAASRNVIKRTTYDFRLYEDQAAGVDYIFKSAAKQTGIQDQSALFEHIVMEWAADHLGDVAKKAEAAVQTHLNKLKKSGVKIPEGHPGAEPPKAQPAV
jgi:hypothetical protein